MRRTLWHNVVLLLMAIFLASNILFSQTSSVRGKITHGKEDLKAATISLAGQTKFTNENGEFYFSIQPGTHTITVTYAGYKKIEQTLVAEEGYPKYIEFDMVPIEHLEEVMLGSRSKNQRSNFNTPVPVDIYTPDQLIETGQVSLTQMLNFLVPSFNASREVLNETITLRGLDPHHVLILVNGIRYHPMAWIFRGNLRGQLGKGSVGNDLNSIPFAAIEKIEILRDGAAAQYGSDAIGGVINIILKKTIEKTFIQVSSGQYYKGDGEKYSIGINHGFNLKKGYLNLSANYRNQNPTFRGGSYEGLVYQNYSPQDDSLRIKFQDDSLVNARGFNRMAVSDNAGNTKLYNTGFVINGGYQLKDHTEFFWTFIANSRKLDRGGIFRFPREKASVNLALYPNGFQHRNKSNTVDVSAIAGMKGRTKKNWLWDFNTSYGINSVKSHVTNTNNASQTLLLGASAPTSFYIGTEKFKQLTYDLNLVKEFLKVPAQFKNTNLGLGTEWRLENYHSKEGEKASWFNYDPLNYQIGGIGVSGPENAINKTRYVLGFYADLETEHSQHFLFNVASRFEYYSDFGSNIAGKLAARYKLSDKFMFRVSVNNGFRAPSLQQRYFQSISSIPVTQNGIRTTAIGGTFPNDHTIIRTLNIPILKAENTVNFSGGFTSTFFNHFKLATDVYWIQINNRIVLSGNFERQPGNTIDAILSPYPDLNAIRQVSFFSNAINTKTKGIDILLNSRHNYGKTIFEISLAANFNSTRLYDSIITSNKLATNAQSSNTLFNAEEITKLEKGQPGSKIILSVTCSTGKIKLNIVNTRFGKTMIAPLVSPAETFSPKILTDISLHYSLKQWATVILGANNVANIYPDQLKHRLNKAQGRWIYSPEASPFGFNGGYYFINLVFNFQSKNKKAVNKIDDRVILR